MIHGFSLFITGIKVLVLSIQVKDELEEVDFLKKVVDTNMLSHLI